MVTSGLSLNLCIAAMLIFRPIKRKQMDNQYIHFKEKDTYDTETSEQNHHNSLIQQMKILSSHRKYLFLWLNGGMVYCGFFMAYSHVAAYAQYQGASPYIAGAMLATLGFCNLAGRLGLSLLSQHPSVSAIHIHTISTLITGRCILYWLTSDKDTHQLM